MKAIKLKLLPHDYPFEGDEIDKREAFVRMRKMIRDAQWQMYRTMNYVMSHIGIGLLAWKDGEKFKLKSSAAKNEIRKIIKTKLEGESREVSGILYSCAANFVTKILVKDKRKKFLNGEMSLPSFRRDCAIPVSFSSKDMGYGNSCGAFWFVKQNGHTCVRLRLYSERGTYNFPIRIGNMDNGTRSILNGILSGRYRAGEGKLYIKKGEIYCNVSYEPKEKKEQKIIEGRIMGVNLGVKKPAACAINTNGWKFKIDTQIAEQLKRYRLSLLDYRRNTSSALRAPLGKRSGHGRYNKIRTLSYLTGKQRDFQKTVNHQISRMIVREAIRMQCEAIVLEDFTKIYEADKHPQKNLRNWSYYELQKFIEYKVPKWIKILVVEPYCISMTCNRCGHSDIENRRLRTKSIFKCIKCGHQEDEDVNAARNSARIGFEQLHGDKNKKTIIDIFANPRDS